MSDVMLKGVLRMPRHMAMGDAVSAFQFYDRAQEALDRMERAEAALQQMAASPSSSVLERAREALRNLIRGYANTLENGRDRIISLSGQCDSVEAMERSDPNLRAARSALAEIDRALGGGK